jgi:hypothetical protein
MVGQPVRRQDRARRPSLPLAVRWRRKLWSTAPRASRCPCRWRNSKPCGPDERSECKRDLGSPWTTQGYMTVMPLWVPSPAGGPIGDVRSQDVIYGYSWTRQAAGSWRSITSRRWQKVASIRPRTWRAYARAIIERPTSERVPQGSPLIFLRCALVTRRFLERGRLEGSQHSCGVRQPD